jgi:hypothetical protein
MPSHEQSTWVHDLVQHLEHFGPEAAAALDYIHKHRIKLGLHDQPTGARWTIRRRIDLNPSFAAGPADDAAAVSLLIHEVRHLQQGPLTALSVYGEMEAWQLQFRFLKEIRGRYHADPSRDAILAEIIEQPLGWERGVLQHVRELMQHYAGPAYRIDLLPLYPLHRELVFRLTGRRP